MRLANTDKAGYFPTDEPVTNMIRTYITAPNGGRILDPCVGEGEALIPLARDLNLIPYGVELAINRAAAAERNIKSLIAMRPDASQLAGRHLLADSFAAMIAPKESFNFIYANPPYLMTENGRAEYAWLRDARPYLQPGGLMIWVIPRHLLHYEKTAPYLLSWFEDIQIFRFPDPFYERFKQVIVFAVARKDRISPEADAVRKIRQLGQPIQAVDIEPLIPAPEPVYTLPALTLPQDQMRFRSWNTSPADASKEAHARGVITTAAFRELIAPTTSKGPDLRPVTPMKIGHLIGVIAAGFLNNQILTNDDERILIKGLSYKQGRIVTVQQENPNAGGKDEHAYTERTTNTDQVITSITTITPKGDVTAYEGAALSSFMAKWLPVLTQVVTDRYPPLYNFDYNGYEAAINKLNLTRKIPIVNRPGLLPAQKHGIAAAATRLENNKDCWIDGEMGTGKTVMGAGVPAIMAAKGYPMNHIIILCPPHLVDKWQREIKFVWPRASAMALTSRQDIDKFFSLPGPIFGVIKETTARAGSGWAHAYQARLGAIMHKPRAQDGTFEILHSSVLTNGHAKEILPEKLHNRLPDLRKRRHVRCPACGHIQTDDEGVSLSPGHFTSKQFYCRKCHGALYQDSRRYTPNQKPTTFKLHANRVKMLAAKDYLPTPTNEGYSRYPLASYIKRQYKGKLDLLIADECHQYKSTDSDRGYAYHRLAVSAKRVLNLTGTTYGGKASTLFSLLYRSSSDMRHAYDYAGENGLKKWINQYGIMQEITEVKFDANGFETGNSRSKTRVTELPGASPAMLPWLLNRAVFISLKDMGMALPDYQEIPVGVYMTSDQQNLYDRFADTLRKEMAERLQHNDKSLLGAYLQALLSWPDSPWRAKRVVDKKRLAAGYDLDAATIAQVPALRDDRLYPKEEEIVELIKAEKANGRRVLLLCQQTSTLDITPQWVKMLKDNGLKAVVLTVEPNKRETWVKQQVKANVDVIITHPKRVETGLDLLDFPTIVWMGTEYSVYTILQASRRSWRIGQDRPVKVYFYYYEDTLQSNAIRLIAAKVGAALRVRGDTLPEDSISEMDDLANADMMTELTRIALQGGTGNQVESLEDLFAKANADVAKENMILGGFDAQAIYTDLGPEPEPAIVQAASPIEETTFKTATVTVGPTISKQHHSTPANGKRFVFGVGMVDAAEADRLMGKTPKQEPEPDLQVTWKKAVIVPTRNGVQAVPIADPDPAVVANPAPPAGACHYRHAAAYNPTPARYVAQQHQTQTQTNSRTAIPLCARANVSLWLVAMGQLRCPIRHYSHTAVPHIIYTRR
ncbi:MAG: hypothetical protein IPM39_24970 [Chloroflexi bacterium]|nr:hypothetical protein [Chloroflexota bacterium]